MKKRIFNINVREILEKVVEVEAEDVEEALSIVEEMYHNQEIILDSDNFMDYEITDFDGEETY